MSPSKVSLVRASDDIEAAVRRSVNLIGGLDLRGDEHVIVKPNICNAKNPDGMVVTDYRIIKTILDLLRQRCDDVIVVESDNIAGSAESRLVGSGLMGLLKEWNVPFLNLSHGDYEEHTVAGCTLKLPKVLLETNYLVNLPKVKTCAHTKVTLGIKNLLGVVQQAKKSRYHKHLDEVLPYLARTVRCDLTVVDGLTCMEGNGPLVGNPVCMNVVLAGRNMVAVDAICCRLMGYDPAEIPHIANAARHGTGPIELDQIKLVGDDLASCARVFEPPYSLKATLKSLKTIKEVYFG
jgi:uncharacterized protein (DUF362 family)